MRMSTEERFWSKVDKTETCWLWTAGLHEFGYGHWAYGGRGGPQTTSHRFAWVVTHGEIPSGMFVCHRCDVPACVNPAHLFLGTHKQNMTDMVARGRNQRGARHALAKLTTSDVDLIRAACAAGETQKVIARRFSVSQASISNIRVGKRWTSHQTESRTA